MSADTSFFTRAIEVVQGARDDCTLAGRQFLQWLVESGNAKKTGGDANG